MKKNLLSITIGVIIIAVAIVFATKNGSAPRAPETGQNAVSIVDGTQYVDIRAKAGFSPRSIVAQANMPTVLRVTTKGTFDCSSSIRIPSLGVSKALEPTGVADIDLGTPQPGVLDGSCGMGMYPFQIDFR